MIVLCGNLTDIATHLEKPWAECDKKYMNRYSGAVFTPMPFSSVDIKHLWVHSISGNIEGSVREYLHLFMSNLYDDSHEIFKIVRSPDVNIKAVSKLIIDAISKIKTQLPRCGKAIRKIEASLNLLETNFDEYYHDFTQSGDETSIFTKFISDVSDDAGDDPSILFQFREIINFYMKAARQNVANGKISSDKLNLLNAISEKYNNIEKKASSYFNITIPDEPSSSPVEPDDPDETPADIEAKTSGPTVDPSPDDQAGE
jgi:hypothetical protein